MSSQKRMDNAATAAAMRAWVTKTHGEYEWPTDACGYEQHERFVNWWYANWAGGTDEERKAKILAYADRLEGVESTETPESGVTDAKSV